MANDVTVHDRSGLLLPSSPPPSDEEINQAELVGIASATEWITVARSDRKQVRFWQRLHGEMFGQVWSWAGEWRLHDSNIGIAPEEIQPQLRVLQENLAYWLSDECDMTTLELLARFHHRLVQIHPFANGNGRWARLTTDALANRELEIGFLTWASGNEDLRDLESDERKRYVAAIKAADKGNMELLTGYMSDLNPVLT